MNMKWFDLKKWHIQALKTGNLKVCANLHGADLRSADLRSANLHGANLHGADLSGANLSGVDLRGANLSGADLSGADLSGANLRDADLDFSCWPLWCGTSKVTVDEKIAKQLLAHAFAIVQPFMQPTEEQVKFCNEFHRIQSGEFPPIKLK